VEWPATVVRRGFHRAPALVRRIGLGGCLLECKAACRPGEAVLLHVCLPDHSTLSATARVAALAGTSDGPPFCLLEFVQFLEFDQRRLGEALLELLRAEMGDGITPFPWSRAA